VSLCIQQLSVCSWRWSLQNVDTVMSETRLPIIGAVIMTLEAGRPTIVKEQVCLLASHATLYSLPRLTVYCILHILYFSNLFIVKVDTYCLANVVYVDSLLFCLSYPDTVITTVRGALHVNVHCFYWTYFYRCLRLTYLSVLCPGTVHFDKYCQWQDGEGLHHGQWWSCRKDRQLLGTFHPQTYAYIF